MKVFNQSSTRALQIIQDEEYLDDIDFDEIKRQKRESSFFENHSQTDFNKKHSVLLEDFRKTLEENQVLWDDENEIVDTEIVTRVKRQSGNFLYFNSTINDIDSLIDPLRNLYNAANATYQQQFCNQMSEYSQRSKLEELGNCNISSSLYPFTVPSVPPFLG